MWFITGYLIYFLMLYSKILWFIIPLYPQFPVLPSPTPFLMATTYLGPFGCGLTLIFLAKEKIP